MNSTHLYFCFKIFSFALLGISVGMLGGCGGGSGGSSNPGITGSTTQTSTTTSPSADPVVIDFPIAYVQRPLLTDAQGNLLNSQVRRATDFFPGAKLILRERASANAEETELTLDVFANDDQGNPALIDVKDVAVSFDGTRLVFAMRGPEDPDLDDEDQPTWNIWLYDLGTEVLSRVISSDLVAEDGHDIAPKFLPDGRIVFSSTRQRNAKAILLDEGKPQFTALNEDRRDEALALHVMNADGSAIRQITFNASSDLDPTITADGRIAYSRWDRVAGRDRFSLYRTNPDGTEQEILYGVHSHDAVPQGSSVTSIEFVEPLELPDGRLLVMMRASEDQMRLGALPVAIDVQNYTEHDQPTFTNAGLLSDAQEVLISGELSLDENTPPRQGRYAHVYPLFDGTNRLLVAWSQCLLRDTTSDPADPIILPCTDANLANPNLVEADPLYGIWMNDLDEQTQQPVVLGVSGMAFSEAVVLEDRTSPAVILDKTAGIELDTDLVAESVGVLNIRSVYDFDGTAVVDIAATADPLQTTADQRQARFLRIVKSVSMPDDDVVDVDGSDFGRSAAQLMREIIGYAPVHPDGSVRVKVPANIAFGVEVLDAQGRRIFERHNNWLQVRAGEEKVCNGCHTSDSQVAHGRLDAEAPSANPGATMDGSPFANTEPALFANAGETMAELITRSTVPNPNVDIVFDDVWTDPAVRAKDASFAYDYAALTTNPPVDGGCVTNWNAICRITIHYPDHIQPIWDVDRSQGLQDDTCTACHATTDAMGAAMVPQAQLDLSGTPSAEEAEHFISYRELLFNDNEQELLDGVVQDRLVQATDGAGNLLFETEADGSVRLDAMGNPVPILVNVVVTPVLRVGGANNSPRFFSLFAPGASHAGRLSPAELKLISEWIDIGGQYYNDPFVTPQ